MTGRRLWNRLLQAASLRGGRDCLRLIQGSSANIETWSEDRGAMNLFLRTSIHPGGDVTTYMDARLLILPQEKIAKILEGHQDKLDGSTLLFKILAQVLKFIHYIYWVVSLGLLLRFSRMQQLNTRMLLYLIVLAGVIPLLSYLARYTLKLLIKRYLDDIQQAI